MTRKFLGFSLLVAVLCLIGCGNSSTEASDECTDDPQSPACVAPAPEPEPAE